MTTTPEEPTMPPTRSADPCPRCGAERLPGAAFCEECAFDFAGEGAVPARPAGAAASPDIRPTGEESPLDTGWTGGQERLDGLPGGGPPRSGLGGDGDAGAARDPASAAPPGAVCPECGVGRYADGYCDNCGGRERDPRDHYVEEPQPWVAGVCDVGLRHPRNEDAMALHAEPAPLSFAVLVVCDGVSNSTDSHVASLAASRAARAVLGDPVPRGVGTRTAVVAAVERRLGEAVTAARQAVVDTTGDRQVESPPSCTIVAALVDHGLAVVGNVGDSRAYWLPDRTAHPARQLSQDDSLAAARVVAGTPRKEAESGTGAHVITRWLGSDSPADLRPHTVDLDLDEDGWLLLCSDGLWNYCSEAEDLRRLVHDAVARLGRDGRPATLARALTDFANGCGGADNVTVSLVRAGPLPPAAVPEPGPGVTTASPTAGADRGRAADDGKDTP